MSLIWNWSKIIQRILIGVKYHLMQYDMAPLGCALMRGFALQLVNKCHVLSNHLCHHCYHGYNCHNYFPFNHGHYLPSPISTISISLITTMSLISDKSSADKVPRTNMTKTLNGPQLYTKHIYLTFPNSLQMWTLTNPFL